MAKKLQLKLLKDEPKAYGGELRTTRKGRARGRPLDTKNTMHLVLRSSQAKGIWSFSTQPNRQKITKIIGQFSEKYGVQVLSMANVGNHLHLQVKLFTRHTYKKFIRAVTSAIVMAVTGVSRVKKLAKHFWDYRPFSRVVIGYRARLSLVHYIEINKLEGFGCNRDEAIFLIEKRRWRRRSS